MKQSLEIRLNRYLAANHNLITRATATELGVRPTHVDYLLRSGRWQVVRRNVYAPAGIHLSPQALTLAACLAVGPGTVASHASAAWLWNLLPQRPSVISVSRCVQVGGGKGGLEGVRIHRSSDLSARDRTVRSEVPITTVARTLCDLGAEASSGILAEAVDRALARRLTTGAELGAAVKRLSRKGRAGPKQLRAGLEARGVVGAPHPSVLEGKVLRLLHAWGITPLKTEAIALGGTYRLDFLLAPKLALEVDGFTYHASPAAKAADTARRNQLVLAGYVVVQSDWLEVTRHPDRLKATVFAALRRAA